MQLKKLLHPKKLRAALQRRWFGHRMSRVPTEPYPRLAELGSDWGGWIVPDDLIDESWTCYCVGAGSDVSFDVALIERYGARVRCIDPFRVFLEQAERQADGDPRITFHEAALATQDGPLRMYGAEDAASGSLSATNLYRTERVVTKPGRSLPSLMAELGDERVDLLKLDIEGSEYDILPALDLPSLGVRVLCIELHHSRTVREAREQLDALRAQGYRLVSCKWPASYTLVRG
jgi:FkbM family methyltransferase